MTEPGLSFDPDGRLPLAVYEDDRERAERRARDQMQLTPRFDPDTALDEMWPGYMAEDVLCGVLADQGIPCERNGGVDALPDLQIENVGGADSKTQHIHTGPWRSSYVVGYTPPRASPPPPYLIFNAYAPRQNVLTVLGIITSTRFFGEARQVRRGERLPSGHVAKLDLHVLPSDRLTDAKRMFLVLREKQLQPPTERNSE